ncbi:hypothetical protein ACFO9E_21550 [Streptomyces maoxianensis]|uniref:NADP-dependent oxidoreductase domain-containing protein n=1 Tax=Streptomyces maoxianensis TaxID=1459942 RepID=A0ABV9GB35_9ACTN
MFVPYFPLASGRISSYHELTSPAKRLGATSAQVAPAWLLRRSPSMAVIPRAVPQANSEAAVDGSVKPMYWAVTAAKDTEALS